jgi:hypothetical protein
MDCVWPNVRRIIELEKKNKRLNGEIERIKKTLEQLIESSEGYLGTAHEVARGSLQEDVYAAKQLLRGNTNANATVEG